MKFKPGLVFGEKLKELFEDAKSNNYAIPAVNITSFHTVNALLACAKKVNSPIIINMSRGGSHFLIGNSLENESMQASIAGSISAAKYINEAAKVYKIPVIIQNDHAPKDSLRWIDGLFEASKQNFQNFKQPLFSFHMLDLSQEKIEENIMICKNYLQKFKEVELFLEFELGVTGGEEDGIDNSNTSHEELFTSPKDVEYAYRQLTEISDNFLVAAIFGNVHGVYKSGNVKLKPKLLSEIQDHIASKMQIDSKKPISFVFHGGSGSTKEEIQEAVSYGVVKMNLDTDFQWAFWDGVKSYYEKNIDFLQSQIGNSNSPDSPNKYYYDPRKWIKAAESSISKRLEIAFEDLNCINRN